MPKASPIVTLCAVSLFVITVISGCSGGDNSSATSNTQASSSVTWFVPEGSTLNATQMSSLFDTSQLYFNVQSVANNNGEIRGEANPSSAILLTDAGDPFAPNPANNLVTFAAILDGAQMRPRNVVTRSSGYGSVTLNPLTKQLTGFIVTSGMAGIAADINDGLPGTSGTVVLNLVGGPVVWTVPASTLLTDAQIARLSAGAFYFNVHSNAFTNGEIRGQLNQQVRFASLKGSNEVPAVSSSATGVGYLALNPTTKQFSGFIKVDGNSSAVTRAVISLGDAFTNGPAIVDLVNNGNGIWSIPVISNPIVSAVVIAAFNSDSLYINIQTLANPGGELRGQILKSSGRIATASLNGTKEIPGVSTQASGTGILAWNSVTGQLSGSVSTERVNGTAANINSGPTTSNGSALIALTTISPVTVTPTPGISFALDIQPIFNARCDVVFCHGPGGIAPMSLRADVSYANTLPLLVPGDSSSSYLIQRITLNNPPSFPQMPLNRTPLTLTEQNLFKNWIDNGALNN